MTEREIINGRAPGTYSEQLTSKMNENGRNILASVLHDDIKRDLVENKFDVVRSSYRGKSVESVDMAIDLREEYNIDKPVWDLCGMRFVFKTDEEIDRAIEWIKEEYCPPEEYKSKTPWISDFRKNEAKDIYQAVHVRLPFQVDIKNQIIVDFMEIQFMTADQEENNNKIGSKRTDLTNIY